MLYKNENKKTVKPYVGYQRKDKSNWLYLNKYTCNLLSPLVWAKTVFKNYMKPPHLKFA